ncbi:unnamed protein product [Triticum turgidum subsp. durum]|uniref:Nodulin-like domain-containing protein n=1 Tax=Triticum turgidum subsp. durum TaxID=4567 RepID=A0A9R0XES7_TRITD|nr:unnamed protein product [Triticum turgidum subsp. durum]
MVSTALDAMAGTAWGRWLGLVAAVWVQCISGNNYTFSNYSDLGYGAQWLVVSKTIAPLPYWQMCVCLCLGGNSTTWMNTAVLVTCIRNFRGSRGPVSGVLKGYVGLSTAIFTDVCSALFADDPASFLVMLAVVPAAVCAVAMVFLREGRVASADSGGDEADARGFAAISTLAVAIALYLLAADLTGVGGGGGLVSTVFVAVLMVLLAAPAAVPAYVGWTSWMKSRKAANADAEAAAAPLLLDSKEAAASEAAATQLQGNGEAEEGRGPRLGEEHTIAEALSSLDFWVLFSSFLMGVGTGLAVMNNLGQMGVAMGYTDVSLFVSMTSIWGFFGRLASGTISEHFIKTRALPRPVWNAASQVLMFAGYVVMAFGMPGSLFVGSVVVGVCYGVRLAVTVPTASELFGLKYYGLIYNILILNLPLGSFLFSGLLAGLLYDAEATKVPGGGNTCSGAHCYRLVFVVMAAACVVGFGLDVLLSLRTRRVYTKIHQAKRAKRSAAAAQRVS